MVSLVDSYNAGSFLETMMRGTRERALLVSPWVSAETLRRFDSWLPKSARLDIVFRWPKPSSELRAIDVDAIWNLQQRRANVVVSYIPRLHAKIYVSDAQECIVTSGNLTEQGLGFGTDSNIELGVHLRGDAAREYVNYAVNLNATPWTKADYERLSAARKLVRAHKPPPAPTLEPPERTAHELALEYLVESGWLSRYEHVARGAGRNTYRLWLKGRKTPVVTKIRRSRREAYEQFGYHFEIGRREADLYWRTRKKRTPEPEAMLFVPLTLDDKFVPLPEPPIVFLRLKDVFRREVITYTQFKKRFRKSDRDLKVYLKKSKNWRLEFAGPRGAAGERQIAQLTTRRAGPAVLCE